MRKRHKPFFLVIDPEPDWDYDRALGWESTKEKAETVAQELATNWDRDIIVAEVLGVFSSQKGKT